METQGGAYASSGLDAGDMICQIVLWDFPADRKSVYVLDDQDFAFQRDRWNEGDPLLDSLQDKTLFRGRRRWCDLDLRHFHLMVINMLNIISSASDVKCASANDPMTIRLVFFFCCVVHILQERTGGEIDMVRMYRLGRRDVTYEFSVAMAMDLPHACGLRVVVDNQ